MKFFYDKIDICNEEEKEKMLEQKVIKNVDQIKSVHCLFGFKDEDCIYVATDNFIGYEIKDKGKFYHVESLYKTYENKVINNDGVWVSLETRKKFENIKNFLPELSAEVVLLNDEEYDYVRKTLGKKGLAKDREEFVPSLERIIIELKEIEVKDIPEKLESKYKNNIYPKRCFGKAYDYLDEKVNVDDVNIKMIHGGVYSIIENKFIKHAWIEINDNAVFDGVLQRFYDKEGYYKYHRAKKIKEYSFKKARMQMLRFHHYGPWEWTKYDDELLHKGE